MFDLWFKDLFDLSVEADRDTYHLTQDTVWLLAHILTRGVVLKKV